jgi:prepilin-type N-terminal cleavage/methylation domain-containing protein
LVAAGFTLLEVMVALAILAMTLVVLLEIVTNNVRATNHAKMTTSATFLARAKMVEIEDIVLENGFSEDDESESGTFKDLGSPGFRWEYTIERIDLPTDMAQKTQAQAQDQTQSAKDPMSMMTGFLGGMMSSFIEPIRIGLQESVRKVTVRVLWDENGRPNQNMEVVQYLTDPAKLDLALTGGGAPGAAPGTTPSVPGMPGAPAVPSATPPGGIR